MRAGLLASVVLVVTALSAACSGGSQEAAKARALASAAASDRAAADAAAEQAAKDRAAAEAAAKAATAALAAQKAAAAQAEAAKRAAAAKAQAAAKMIHNPLAGVAWSTVNYPMDCSPVGFTVLQVSYAELTGDNNKDAVALVTCNAGAGTPPVALYAFDGASSVSSPRLLATLLSDREGRQANAFSVVGRTIRMTAAGFSSDSVPNCCPDETFHYQWVWHGEAGGYTFSAG